MNESEKRASTDIFRTIYPVFKLEIYRRRRNMMALARWGSVAFYILTLFNLTVLSSFRPALTERLVLSSGAFLLVLLWLGQIRQERLRHREAKSRLIFLEKRAGLFTEGAFFPGESLYPSAWEASERRDLGPALDLFVLAILAIVSILTILAA